MPNVSNRTKIIAFRVPIDVYNVLERRVQGKRNKHDCVNSYVRSRVIYDTLRR